MEETGCALDTSILFNAPKNHRSPIPTQIPDKISNGRIVGDNKSAIEVCNASGPIINNAAMATKGTANKPRTVIDKKRDTSGLNTTL
jgi:hypothetical protein